MSVLPRATVRNRMGGSRTGTPGIAPAGGRPSSPWFGEAHPTQGATMHRIVIDLGGPDGGRYWVVTNHSGPNAWKCARDAAIAARMTGSVGARSEEGGA